MELDIVKCVNQILYYYYYSVGTVYLHTKFSIKLQPLEGKKNRMSNTFVDDSWSTVSIELADNEMHE